MPIKFPLPPDYFRALSLKPEETRAHRELAKRIVEETYREYQQYVADEHVDELKWKVSKTKERLQICMRRLDLQDRASATRSGSDLSSSRRVPDSSAVFMAGASFAMHSKQASALQQSANLQRRDSRQSVSSGSGNLSSVCDDDAQNSARLLDPTVLVAGQIAGTIEDFVNGVNDATAEMTRNVNAILGEDQVIDCAVLHTIKSTKATYLGLKWKAIRTLAGNRDVTYLEYVGFARDASGQRFGYHVLESVKLWQCPSFDDHSISRTELSFCFLFCPSKQPGTVDVYLVGTFDSPANPIASGGLGDPRLTLNQLLSVESGMMRSACKKLTQMVEQSTPPTVKPKSSSPCAICTAKPGMLNPHFLCQVCNKLVCAKCRLKMAVAGWKGKKKASCCKRCLVEARENSPFAPHEIQDDFVIAPPPQERASNDKDISRVSTDSDISISGMTPTTPLLQSGHSLVGMSKPGARPVTSLYMSESMTETEYDPTLHSWASSSASSADLSPSPRGSGNGNGLVCLMPATAELALPRRNGIPEQHCMSNMPQDPYGPGSATRMQEPWAPQRMQQQQPMMAPPTGYTQDGMAPVGYMQAPMATTSLQDPRAPIAGPPPMQQASHTAAMHQHQMDIYQQMMKLTMQAEETYNIAHNRARYGQP